MVLKKNVFFAATGALALLSAAPSFAADQKAAPAQVPPAKASGDNQTQSQGQIQAATLVGKNLTSSAGKTIGDINSIIIDDDGKVAAVIVGVGGFLGMGEREVAIGWKEVNVRDNGKTVQTNLTKAQLQSLPEYKYRQASDRGRVFKDPAYRSDFPSGKSMKQPSLDNSKPSK